MEYKIVSIVIDNQANILKAVELGFGKNRVFPMSAVSDLLGLILKVKAIVTWFKARVVASDELRKARSTETKLIQEVSTRWNSTYFMNERFLELKMKMSNENVKWNCQTL